MTALITVVSIAASVAVTLALDVFSEGAAGFTGFAIAVFVPAIVAPIFGGITIRLAYQLDRAEVQARQWAVTDDLTGAANRRHFFALAASEFERARRYAYPFAIVIIDLDDFKRVNDTHGHPAGDAVLRAVSDLCRRQIRAVDTFARYGGEEFVFLMPGTGATEAVAFAERLRDLLATTPIPFKGHELRVTISAGVSGWRSDDTDLDALIVRADDALYQAKAQGKNQIEER